MCTVKKHIRKGRNKAVPVRQHERKSRLSKYREAKYISPRKRETLTKSKEALPDGSFPISSKRDLANAITTSGRSKNPEIVRRWIKKRAKVLNSLEMIPKNW